jgi:hypothetical protein
MNTAVTRPVSLISTTEYSDSLRKLTRNICFNATLAAYDVGGSTMGIQNTWACLNEDTSDAASDVHYAALCCKYQEFMNICQIPARMISKLSNTRRILSILLKSWPVRLRLTP